MVTSLGFLKEASKIERTLAEISCQRTLKRLEPYAGFPEVAKVIDYIQNYKTDVPSSHMVFKFIESIEDAKKTEEQVKDLVRTNLSKKGLLSAKQNEILEQEKKRKSQKVKELTQEEEAEIKKELDKSIKNAEKMEALMIELEKQCDVTYDFFNKNANSIGRVCKPYKLTGVRNLLMSLKGNIRALKVR
jgi:hypothetical protein